MAERRDGPFPVHGDQVVAEDGTTWLYLVDNPVLMGHWEQVDMLGFSREDGERAQAYERELRSRLEIALHVWERAHAAAPWTKTVGADIRRTDPITTFVELIARAILTELIAETSDGQHQDQTRAGAPLGIAYHTTQQVAALVGPASARRVAQMLQRHTLTVRTTLAERRRKPPRLLSP